MSALEPRKGYSFALYNPFPLRSLPNSTALSLTNVLLVKLCVPLLRRLYYEEGHHE